MGFSATALATFDDFKQDLMSWNPRPYIGLEPQYRSMSWENGFGKNEFKKHSFQENYYLGLKLNRYLGLEVGFEQTPRKEKKIRVLANDTVLGQQPVAGATNADFFHEHKTWGSHANIMFYLPLHEPCKIQAFGHLGASRVSIAASQEERTLEDGSLSPLTKIAVEGLRRDLKGQNWNARAGIGLQMEILPYTGIRTSINWENTSHHTLFSKKPGALELGKPKDSYSAGIGLFFIY